MEHRARFIYKLAKNVFYEKFVAHFRGKPCHRSVIFGQNGGRGAVIARRRRVSFGGDSMGAVGNVKPSLDLPTPYPRV